MNVIFKPRLEGVGVGPHTSLWINSGGLEVLDSEVGKCCWSCILYWQSWQKAKDVEFVFTCHFWSKLFKILSHGSQSFMPN